VQAGEWSTGLTVGAGDAQARADEGPSEAQLTRSARVPIRVDGGGDRTRRLPPAVAHAPAAAGGRPRALGCNAAGGSADSSSEAACDLCRGLPCQWEKARCVASAQPENR